VSVIPSVVICDCCGYVEDFYLPGPGRLVVNAGDPVTPGDAVGYVVERGPITVVDVAGALGVPPRRCGEFIEIREGQSVRLGELLARRERFFGTKEVRAPVAGRAMAVGAGMILLEELPRERAVYGALAGRAREIYPGEGLRVEGSGTVVWACSLIGGDFSGALKMTSPVPDRVLRPEHIDVSCHGSIVIGGIGDEIEALERAAGFGAKGAILGSAPATWARMSLPLPVAITEAYGAFPMNSRAFEALGKTEGYLAYVMQRGRRTWIVVPQVGDPMVEVVESRLRRAEKHSEVRIVAGPRTGRVGRVLSLGPGDDQLIVDVGGERVEEYATNCEAIIGDNRIGDREGQT